MVSQAAMCRFIGESTSLALLTTRGRKRSLACFMLSAAVKSSCYKHGKVGPVCVNVSLVFAVEPEDDYMYNVSYL